MVHIENSWDFILKDEFTKDYYLKLRSFLKFQYFHYTVFPKMENIFNALKLTAYEDVKVCILGQDPYHGPHQAHGLCFSVEKGVQYPPSLQNIFKELSAEYPEFHPASGNLTPWARQGILLLNTVLTVREGLANSHKGQGWEEFTDGIIKKLNERSDPIIFVLWGGNAKAKEILIDHQRHFILKAAHPSPLSAYNGFFGCRHFQMINELLVSLNKEPIDWTLPELSEE